MKNLNENLVLAKVVDIIETKTGNDAYRNLVFDVVIEETDDKLVVNDFNVKCVSIKTADLYSKALKAGKLCYARTTYR